MSGKTLIKRKLVICFVLIIQAIATLAQQELLDIKGL